MIYTKIYKVTTDSITRGIGTNITKVAEDSYNYWWNAYEAIVTATNSYSDLLVKVKYGKTEKSYNKTSFDFSTWKDFASDFISEDEIAKLEEEL